MGRKLIAGLNDKQNDHLKSVFNKVQGFLKNAQSDHPRQIIYKLLDNDEILGATDAANKVLNSAEEYAYRLTESFNKGKSPKEQVTFGDTNTMIERAIKATLNETQATDHSMGGLTPIS